MRLPKARIEEAASKEETRFTLRAVKVDVEKKRAMATDGHMLAIVPCEVSDSDKSSLLSTDSIKQIRAMEKRAKSTPVTLSLGEKVSAIGRGETGEYDLVTGQFPNVDAVIPKYDLPVTISFNAELLYRLAKAMTATGDNLIVSLTVKDRESSILVKAGANPEAIGVLMPTRS